MPRSGSLDPIWMKAGHCVCVYRSGNIGTDGGGEGGVASPRRGFWMHTIEECDRVLSGLYREDDGGETGVIHGFLLHRRLAQTNAYLTEMRMELERHSEDNSRQLESLNGNDTSLFERDMDMYKSEHTRLQKANRILIDEIKDLLTICYGNRKVGMRFMVSC